MNRVSTRGGHTRSAIRAGAVLGVVLLAACGGGGRSGTNSVPLSAVDNGKTVTVHPSDLLVLTLESNASTGYRWVLKGTPDANVVRLVDSAYVQPTTNLIGASGQEVWRFRAVGAGSSALELSYERSSGETAGRPFRVTVQVSSS